MVSPTPTADGCSRLYALTYPRAPPIRANETAGFAPIGIPGGENSLDTREGTHNTHWWRNYGTGKIKPKDVAVTGGTQRTGDPMAPTPHQNLEVLIGKYREHKRLHREGG